MIKEQIKKIQKEIRLEYTCNAFTRITGKNANELTPRLKVLYYNRICCVLMLGEIEPYTELEEKMLLYMLLLLRHYLRKEFRKLKKDSKKER